MQQNAARLKEPTPAFAATGRQQLQRGRCGRRAAAASLTWWLLPLFALQPPIDAAKVALEPAKRSGAVGGLEFVASLIRSSTPQATLEEYLASQRSLSSAGMGPTRQQALRREVGLLLGSAKLNSISSLGAARTVGPSPDELVAAHAELNEKITQTRLDLDRKVAECQVRPAALQEAAREAAVATQELSSEVSLLRGTVLKATSGYPEDREVYQTLRASAEMGTRECEMARQAYEAKAAEQEEHKQHLVEIRTSLAKYCGQPSLLQSRPLSTKPSFLASAPLSDGRQNAFLEQLFAQASATSEGRIASSISRLIATVPNHEVCAQVQDALSALEGEARDDDSRLQADMAESQAACEEDRAFERRQMQLAIHRKGDASSELWKADGKLPKLEERARIQDQERAVLEKQAAAAAERCHHEVDDLLHGKLCRMQNMRDQLWLTLGHAERPQDCAVTEWADGACSATCGGGVRNSTREVLLSASDGGATCPPLSAQGPCGQDACPTNCNVGDWTGWSSCSADCDGGVQERSRVVTTQAHNGDPCPNLVSIRACNSKACIRNCQLGVWTAWSSCSQACNGGTQKRSRGIDRDALGSGACPSADSAERLELKPCNAQACSEGTRTRSRA